MLPTVLSVLSMVLPMMTAGSFTEVSVTHLGCYYDTNQNYVSTKNERLVGDDFHLMPYYAHKMLNIANPQLCAKHCASKGYMFAALKESSCSCGQSDVGLIKATTHAIGQLCSEKCPGNRAAECGGKNVISVYRSIPKIRFQFPTRCSNGYWRLMLNQSDNGKIYMPDLTEVGADQMLWTATNFSPENGANTRLSMDLCTYKCETISTCWGIVLHEKPGVYRACALLDQPTMEQVSKKIIPKNHKVSHDEDINYGYQIWRCDTMQSDSQRVQSKKTSNHLNKLSSSTSSSAALLTIPIISLYYLCT